MPRQIADQPIRTKTQRAKLKPRRKPYYRRLSDSMAIGYRRLNTPPGTWVVRRRDADGSYSEAKLSGVSPDDVVDANGIDILSFDQACTRAREVLAPSPDEITLEKAAEDWAEAKIADTDNRTRQQNFRNEWKRLAGKFPADQPVSTITAKQVQAFRDGYLIKGADPDTQRKRRATANKALATLKAILNRACDTHSLDITRPWATVQKFKKAESFSKRIIVLDAAQRRALLDACTSPALRDLVLAGMTTGCRYGELISARVRDLEGRKLAVTGKTGTRTLTLSPAACAHLHGLVDGANDPDRFILLRDDGTPWKDGDQLGVFATAIKRAGLPTDATFYCLRHSYITAHLTAGVPVTALAQQCGTSTGMIEQTYAHFLGADLERWFSLEVGG